MTISALRFIAASTLFFLGMQASAQQEFDRYAAAVERRIAQQHDPASTQIAVLNVPAAKRSEIERELRSGALLVQAVDGGIRLVRFSQRGGNGLLHHWRGAAFVPGARAMGMLALLRDYRDLPTNYAPQVQSCRIVFDRTDRAKLTMRLSLRKVVTVVLDADYDVQTGMNGPDRGYGISRSTRVEQIDDAGTRHERARPPGEDDGFLWRLNSYWSFIEVNGGLLIELEAISLTRNVPAGLGWLVLPAVEQVPRESLEFTLRATARALAPQANEEAHR